MADNLIQISGGGDTSTFTVPEFGYKTQIILPFTLQKLSNGLSVIKDFGSAYDKRICSCNFILDATEAAIFESKFSQYYDDTNINLNCLNSGFMPFSPDKGGNGDMLCLMELDERNGVGEQPYKYFSYKVRFLKTTGSWPAYTPTLGLPEGTLQIGTVTGLRFPPLWFKPETKHLHFPVMNEGLTIYYNNRDKSTYSTKFSMTQNQGNTATLIKYLVNTARASDFSMISDTNYFPFGRENPDTTTFTVRPLYDTIEITHEDYNRFTFDLSLQMVSHT